MSEIPAALLPNPEVPAAPQVAPAMPAQPQLINVFDPETDQLGSIPIDQADVALSQGFTPATPEQLEAHAIQEKYGKPTEQAKAFLEGAGVGGTLGMSTLLERAMGVSPEDIRGRAEANPISHGVGQGAGFGLSALIPGVGEANVAADVGMAGVKALGLGAEGAGILSRALAKGLPMAADFVAMQGGDEISKMLSNDPNQSVDTAVTNIGLSGLLGLGGGTALGAISPLWKASAGGKLSQFIDDFKGRMAEHIENPNPAHAVHEELTNYYRGMSDAADTVYGAKGIKAQGINKHLPEMNDKIVNQVDQIRDTLKNKLVEFKDDPFVGKLQRQVEKWESAIDTGNPTPASIFDATQDLKQQLQEWGKYNKNFVALGEKDFRDVSKSLAFELRSNLENPEVWGKAADVQKQINKAFSEYLPTLKDFEKKFTTEINGERVIDPGKVNTYVNQLGKSSAEIKQSMMDNFLRESEKYKDVIGKTHAELGLEAPTFDSGLNLTRKTLNEVSPGAKAADIVIKKGLAGPAGMIAGAGVGAGVGSFVGHPGIGAIIGEHALGPFFSSILPALTKPLLTSGSSSEGMKAAIDYGLNVVKGNALINRATKNVFMGEAENFARGLTPTEKERDKLDKHLKEMQADTNKMFEVGGTTGHYLPGHGTAISATAMNAVSYLNSQRPQQVKLSPLDATLKPNPVAKAHYDRTLNIAQQPLVVMGHLKEGTLTPSDVITLKTLYPALYQKLNTEINGKIIEASEKEKQIPYKTRLGLSIFTGQALDSTMLPQSIIAAQPQSAGQQSQGAQTSGEKAKSSMTALNKQPGLYQTSQQAREQRHTM